MHQEELRSGGVGVAGARGTQDSGGVRDFIELRVDGIARAARAMRVSRLIFGIGVATLDHEAGNHTVESDAIVEPFGCEFLEILSVSGGVVGEEFDNDSTMVGLNHGDIVAIVGGSCAGGGSWFEFAHGVVFI